MVRIAKKEWQRFPRVEIIRQATFSPPKMMDHCVEWDTSFGTEWGRDDSEENFTEEEMDVLNGVEATILANLGAETQRKFGHRCPNGDMLSATWFLKTEMEPRNAHDKEALLNSVENPKIPRAADMVVALHKWKRQVDCLIGIEENLNAGRLVRGLDNLLKNASEDMRFELRLAEASTNPAGPLCVGGHGDGLL